MAEKKKVAFGGYQVNFKGCKTSLEEVMGNKPLPPSQMTSKLWKFVKANNLAGKA